MFSTHLFTHKGDLFRRAATDIYIYIYTCIYTPYLYINSFIFSLQAASSLGFANQTRHQNLVHFCVLYRQLDIIMDRYIHNIYSSFWSLILSIKCSSRLCKIVLTLIVIFGYIPFFLLLP